MLPSLQDLPGLLPGIFHRGDGAAAEHAGRGLGHRKPPVDLGQNGHGRHEKLGHEKLGHENLGRDRLHLSPEARAVKEALNEDGDSVGEAAVKEADSKSLLGQAGGFVRQALETIRHDLGKALKAFGFDSDTIQQFTQAFVEPVLSALKEGVNFSAELSFAAFRQVTTSGPGGVSQSTSLVAQSLEIEVNRDTGEVSVSLAKLSFEEEFRATTNGGQAPLLVLDSEELASPVELAQKILDSGVKPVEGPDAAPAEGTEDAAVPADASEGEAGEAAAQPSQELEETLADVRKKLAEDAVELQTRLTIYSVSTYKNDKGESITRLLLDAQLKIAALADDAAVQEGAESLNLTA